MTSVAIPTGRPITVYLQGLNFPLTMVLDKVTDSAIYGLEVVEVVSNEGVRVSWGEVDYPLSRVMHVHVPFLH